MLPFIHRVNLLFPVPFLHPLQAYQAVMSSHDVLQKKWTESEATMKKTVKLTALNASVARKPQFWMIEPHGYFKMAWDAIIVCFSTYLSIMVFLRIGFAFSVYYIDLRSTAWIDFVAEMFFVVDCKHLILTERLESGNRSFSSSDF